MRGSITSPRSWPSTWAASFSTWGLVDANPTSAVVGGADAPQTLLAPFRVELLCVCCTTANPAFDSWIFLMGWHVFVLKAADGGGPEAPVISTSGSLPTEENSASSSAGWRSSAGAVASFPGSPSSRGARDQYSKTLACKIFELYYIQMGVVGKIEETTRK